MLSEYNSSIMQANNENRIININTHSRPRKLQTLKANLSKNPARKSLTQKINMMETFVENCENSNLVKILAGNFIWPHLSASDATLINFEVSKL